MVNVKQKLYFAIHRLRGSKVGSVYARYQREDRQRQATLETSLQQLRLLLAHCRQSVPYYAEQMRQFSGHFQDSPATYLTQFPILSKALLRQNFERLKSTDLGQRRWYENTSGGSTGEPARFIQDRCYWDYETAAQMLSCEWAGQVYGEPALYLWGFAGDIAHGQRGLKWAVNRFIAHNDLVNAYRMTPSVMQSVVERLNHRPPRLIVAYANVIYELALFVERGRIPLRPQVAILTSGSTLHDFMREKVEAVFGCKIFDRYGSREVGDIACECEAHAGLHTFPWNCYVEIADDAGNLLPPGVEGNILVTSLVNFAMPLLRYQIGDRGVLSPDEACACGRRGQRLRYVSGRINDTFRRADGTLVSGGYFTRLLYYRDWVAKFQIVQKGFQAITFRLVKTDVPCRPEELEEIRRQAQAAMGEGCQVDFEFVEDIPVGVSGKHRYTICEIA
ncbi:MAG: phenylacetate--CoA ligase family protein [Chloroflexota bacterium]